MDEPSRHPDRSPALNDRGGLLTEQRNPRSMRLDSMSVEECVALINQEDANVAHAVALASTSVASFIHGAEERMRRGGRLVYFGAGTSGRLGVLDASECPPTFQTSPDLVVGIIAGGDSALRRSSEGMEDDEDGVRAELDRLKIDTNDSVLGIAAGGTTPYVLGGLDIAHARGAFAGLLTCTPITKPTGCDVLIVVETGPEVLTGSTRMKAGTATKLVLNTISTTLMVRLGKTYENLMVDLRATNAKLKDRAARITMALTGLARDEALSLLEHADWSVKTAAVMHRKELPRADAEIMLSRCNGSLRAALESGSNT